MIEPKIGEIITVENVKYITKLAVNPDIQCDECCLYGKPCMHISCTSFVRKDSKAVIFKKVKEMEVKIQIPDNCELIKDGDTYIVKEKKQGPPRSWEEFCERYPVKKEENYIGTDGQIHSVVTELPAREYKNWCTSKEEAEAFLALMQLRQLRKAWVGDWEPTGQPYYCIIPSKTKISVMDNFGVLRSLSFPTQLMAYDFLDCFWDLCAIAKPLL